MRVFAATRNSKKTYMMGRWQIQIIPEETMEIKRSGTQPSGKGPADYFTGAVRVDPLFEATDPARMRRAHVTFEPGARTAWHTHPLGQTLIVTSALAGCSARAAPSRKFAPVTSCGSRRREALARRAFRNGDDAYRHPRSAKRQAGRLDGACDRRAVWRLNKNERKETS
jgi:hypothetical protein